MAEPKVRIDIVGQAVVALAGADHYLLGALETSLRDCGYVYIAASDVWRREADGV